MSATAEVRIRRRDGQPTCDVIVAVGGRQMIVTVSDYDRALRWAQMECKSYGIPPALPIAEIYQPL